MTHSPEKPFNRETIQRLFAEMGNVARERGQTMEIAVYGGSALALAFDWRVSTCDVDYMPVRGAEADIRGRSPRNLHEDWACRKMACAPMCRYSRRTLRN
ncbi:MAG: hypothetical protein ACYDCF_11435 [Burkholderiales bacterium]